MAIDHTIKAGDRVPELTATLTDDLGAPVPLTDAVGVVFRLTNIDAPSGTPTVNAAGIIDSALGGVVRYAWAATDTDTPGIYFGEFQVNWSDGRATTFPNDGHLLIRIVAQLA